MESVSSIIPFLVPTSSGSTHAVLDGNAKEAIVVDMNNRSQILIPCTPTLFPTMYPHENGEILGIWRSIDTEEEQPSPPFIVNLPFNGRSLLVLVSTEEIMDKR